MTTRVTITTHDWPVKVSGFPLDDREPLDGGDWADLGAVPPNSGQDFHVHSGQDILVRELPAEWEGDVTGAAQVDEAA